MTDPFNKSKLPGSQPSRILIWLLVVLCLFPFLYLSQYNLPLSDEFIAMHYRSFLGHIEYQQLLIEVWSGRYTANLMESLYPLSINLWFYRCVPVLALLFLFLGIYAATRHLFPGDRVLVSLMLLVILLNYIPSPGDLMYYTPAVIIYTLSMLIFLGIIAVSLSAMPLKLRLPLLIFLELLLMGTSETYIPLVLLFSGIFLTYAFFNKNAFLGPALVNLILAAVITGILVSFSGNQNRLDAQSTFNIKHGIFNYLHSLPLWTWRFLPALPLLAWIISVYRKDPGQRPAADVPVGLVPVALAGYFIMFTPLIFINLSLYKRLGNVFYFYFLIVAVATCMKLPRWFDLAAKTPKLIVFLLFLIFVSTGNIKLAYNDILHGYTKNYSQSLMSRFRYLEDHRGSSKVILPEIPKTDYVLSIQDVNSQDDILVIGLYNPLQLYYSIDTITTD